MHPPYPAIGAARCGATSVLPLKSGEEDPCLKGNLYVTKWPVRVIEYLDSQGQSPFAGWFGRLDARAAAKIAVTIARIGQGNLSNTKGVGKGVLEYRLDFGPGYRVYFGRDGDELVILLAGGTKQRRQKDIVQAQERWQDYRRRRKEG